jgi:hypothetical protein
VVVVQVLTPATPAIAHEPIPLGATAPEGPVTVAVNVIVEPRVALDALAITEIVGVDLPTVVVAPEVGAVLK